MSAAAGDAGVSPEAVLRALGHGDATVAEPVSGGSDTLLWRVRGAVGTGDQALRVLRADQESVWRGEVAAMRTAEAGGVPVPRVAATGIWDGRPAMLLSWCAGRTLLEAAKARPGDAARLGVAFGRMQARVHGIAAPPELSGQADTWITCAGPDEAALQAMLRAVARPSGGLLHLDYHPLNVLAEGGRISAVLDWTNARAGDRRADLARTLSILRLAPLPPGTPALPAALLRVLLMAGWCRGYQRVAGPWQGMAPFHAWAGAAMARDLEPKIGRRGSWFQARHLEPPRRWANAWKRRAGIGV